jgi:hypothetical protein
MAWIGDSATRRKMGALGLLVLALAALAAAPQWPIRAARAVYEGFFELFLAGWMC